MFQIGTPVTLTKNPTNCYKLVIENMSGDADHYEETETIISKEYEPLIEDIIELCNWSQKSWPSRSEIGKKWKEIKSKHFKFFQEEFDEAVLRLHIPYGYYEDLIHQREFVRD